MDNFKPNNVESTEEKIRRFVDRVNLLIIDDGDADSTLLEEFYVVRAQAPFAYPKDLNDIMMMLHSF